MTRRLAAAVLFLAVTGLLLTWAVVGTRPPCVRSTITDTCADDAVAWDAVPDAVGYHLEGWTMTPEPGTAVLAVLAVAVAAWSRRRGRDATRRNDAA